MKRCILALVVILLAVPASWAHFIWIVPGENRGESQVIFSDSLLPDDPKLLPKIAKTALFLRYGASKPVPVQWSAGKDAYRVKVEDKEASVLSAVCDYGVIQKGAGEPFLLKYNATVCLKPTPAYSLAPLERMELEIRFLPEASGVFAMQALWHGKPLEGAEMVFLTQGGDTPIEAKSGKNGEYRFGKPGSLLQPGTYGVRARHVEAKEGEHDGKKYKEVRHYATLVLRVDDKKTTDVKEDPAASKLLAEARAARARWVNFPGFRADAEVNFNGKVSKGQVVVESTGKVRFENIDKDMDNWARRTLASTVGHRLDESASRNTPCAFLDDNKDHPLGRSIRVLNDELHSSYRIRDNQIMEVNRTMKDGRFSISVLENRRNAEGQFLSVAFMINFWNQENGELQRTEAQHQTWTRVGKFDLPVTTTVIAGTRETSAAGSGKSAQSLTLSNHKLLEGAAK